ncbi:unnamed protein product [Rhizoctonia solani]|uniref:BHLH domain-containing protein n=1 Tax=Rhizoctonia solani TaxID=456999 RepID=A0A8H3DLE0_9AGAM|nr:unnamed protein product [Rhizoctonia solani]
MTSERRGRMQTECKSGPETDGWDMCGVGPNICTSSGQKLQAPGFIADPHVLKPAEPKAAKDELNGRAVNVDPRREERNSPDDCFCCCGGDLSVIYLAGAQSNPHPQSSDLPMAGFDEFTFPPPSWESPVASGSRTRGHSRHSSTSSIPPYVPVNTGRRGSTKDPEALQAALERQKNRKRRTDSTASATLPTDDDNDSTSVMHQRQEDARLIRCDAEQQRRNELGKGYDRLRAVLNRGDERLSKSRVVERATARVVQLRDQNERMEDELRRKQELIRDLNRANEQLMLEASGAAPLLVSSPHSASSSTGRPGSSSHTSVNFAGPAHDRSSSLPTPPHTYTGLQHPDPAEFGTHSTTHYPSKQDPFAYNPALETDPRLYPPAEFYAAAPHALGVPRSESPLHPFLGEDQAHWPTEWNATGSGLPGTFTDITTTPAGFTTSSSAYGQP